MLKDIKPMDFCYASYNYVDGIAESKSYLLNGYYLKYMDFFITVLGNIKKILRTEKYGYLGNTLQFSTQKHNAL